MRALSSLRLSPARHALLRHPQPAAWRDAARAISYTAARRNAQPTPPVSDSASAASIPATDKGKGKESATDVKLDDAADDALPFLSRPLGVSERPTTEPRTWREDMMDQDTRTAHRRALVKEAAKGYFTDLNATRRHGGKTWVAPPVLIREDKALYFPDIAGTTLQQGNKAHTTDLFLGKVTVLNMLSSKISEIQSQLFLAPLSEELQENSNFQHVSINLQENMLKSMLVSFFASSIRKSIPETQWGRYLISSQNMDYVREDMGMVNKHIAYVYLIDPACRIRWAACGDPVPGEVTSLKKGAQSLLKRLKK